MSETPKDGKIIFTFHGTNPFDTEVDCSQQEAAIAIVELASKLDKAYLESLREIFGNMIKAD